MKLNSLILGLLFFATAISLLLCWLPIFSAETNDFLYQKLFYILMGLSLMVEATMFSGKTVKILLILSGIGTIAGVIFSQQNETFLSIKNISLLLGFVITVFHINDIKRD